MGAAPYFTSLRLWDDDDDDGDFFVGVKASIGTVQLQTKDNESKKTARSTVVMSQFGWDQQHFSHKKKVAGNNKKERLLL